MSRKYKRNFFILSIFNFIDKNMYKKYNEIQKYMISNLEFIGDNLWLQKIF